MKFSLLLFLLFTACLQEIYAQKGYVPSDVAITVPVPYDYKAIQKYKGLVRKSYFVTMRDSVKLDRKSTRLNSSH